MFDDKPPAVAATEQAADAIRQLNRATQYPSQVTHDVVHAVIGELCSLMSRLPQTLWQLSQLDPDQLGDDRGANPAITVAEINYHLDQEQMLMRLAGHLRQAHAEASHLCAARVTT